MTDVARPLVADGDDPARLRRCRSASASRTWAPTTTEHTPYVIHRALLGSLERFIGILIEHYGGAFPFWLAPVQVRVLPVGEGQREAAHELAARLAALPRRGRRLRRDRRQADPQRRARQDPVHGRLRRQGERRLARGPRARRRAVDAVARGIRWSCLLRFPPGKQGRNRLSPPDPRSRGFNRTLVENGPGRCLQRLCHFRRRATRTW